MALFLEKYVEKNMSHTDPEKNQAAWLQRWKDGLRNPSRLPHKVMKAYLEYTDMSMDVLDNQMDQDWRTMTWKILTSLCWQIHPQSYD